MTSTLGASHVAVVAVPARAAAPKTWFVPVIAESVGFGGESSTWMADTPVPTKAEPAGDSKTAKPTGESLPLCVVLKVSAPAAVRVQTYRPSKLMADPFVGSVHPDGVVEVTWPTVTTISSRPAVGENGVPSTTLLAELGSMVCTAVPFA